MIEKIRDHGSEVALDLGRLLGFKHVAISSGNEALLARAIGATCNMIGNGEVPPGPLLDLASALGATYNKAGEGPVGVTT